ncbi:MAG TPA: hypothetical protein VNC78_01860 [Actinomycetota bacterium]|nr:hypothetical protein [Actinomycetota bacterium]
MTLLWVHAVGLAVFGLIRGYEWTHAVAEASVIAIAAMGATVVRGRATRAVIATLGLMSASGILVHLSGGTIEAHFHFFVMVTLITLYQSWVPFLLSIVYVVVHHGVMGTLDPGSVYNHPAAVQRPFLWATIHGAFILGASMAGLIVWKRNEDLRLREQEQALELHDTVVQGLVAARMALELEVPNRRASELIDATLAEAKSMVARIMRAASDQREWRPGDFVRQEGATLVGDSAAKVHPDE